MADYTVADIRAAMINQCPKCTHAQIITGIAISLAENTARNRHAVNHNKDGSNDLGPWQINSVHNVPDSCRQDLVCSTGQAFKISSGFTNWQPWSTYTNGAYKAHTGEAEKAAGGDNTQGSGILGTGIGPDVAPGLSDNLNPLKGIDLLATTVEKFVEGLFSSALWFRVGKIVIGLFLGGAAIIILARKAGINPPIPIPV